MEAGKQNKSEMFKANEQGECQLPPFHPVATGRTLPFLPALVLLPLTSPANVPLQALGEHSSKVKGE